MIHFIYLKVDKSSYFRFKIILSIYVRVFNHASESMCCSHGFATRMPRVSIKFYDKPTFTKILLAHSPSTNLILRKTMRSYVSQKNLIFGYSNCLTCYIPQPYGVFSLPPFIMNKEEERRETS